ncbi:MAG: FG-GAP-like repeat-containing protein, partial [Ghiorsea sp.]
DNTGNWTSQPGPITAMQPLSFATSDINNNSRIDILIGGKGDLKGLQVWELSEEKTWDLISSPIDIGIFSSVRFADINQDGWDDIIAVRLDDTNNGGIIILLNDGMGGWVDGIGPTTSGVFTGLEVVDINGDNHLDIIASRRSGLGSKEDDNAWKQVGGVQIWYGDGNGRWKPTELPAESDAESLAIADIDGDGDLDIAAGLYQQGITVWWNKNNSWNKHVIINKGTWSALKIGDIDNSGNNTLVAGSSVGQGVHIWKWHGNSFSEKHHLVPDFGNYFDIDLGDIHQDKSLAIASTRENSGLEIWSNKQSKPLIEQLTNNNGARLPQVMKVHQRNLYNIQENKVFKTIDGIAEYKVGPGDELSITFWQGAKSDIKKVIVHIDGTVSLPYQAALVVAGKTPREIDMLITDILKRYERNPRVDIHLVKARSKHASIFGEVKSLSRQPTGAGHYELHGKENLVDFLSRAGGPSKEANLNSVQVIRNGQTILLNLNRAIRQGDLSENIIIDDGDTIFIPSLAQSKRQVYVLGEVNKKGIVEFSDNINFLDAISQSGGLTNDAYLPDIRVIRANREQPEILPVNFERFIEQGDLTQNLVLMDKDIIIIPSRPIANWNKYISDISPTITLLLQPVSIAQQILTLKVLSNQVK